MTPRNPLNPVLRRAQGSACSGRLRQLGVRGGRAALRARLKSSAAEAPLNPVLAEAKSSFLWCTTLSLIEGHRSRILSFQQ